MPKRKIDDLKLLEDYSNGLSRYEIAKKYSMNVSSVSERLLNLGMPKKEFTNRKEWKKLVLAKNGWTRHMTLSNSFVLAMGFKKDDVIEYKTLLMKKGILVNFRKKTWRKT